jgi:hypothetical protein
MFEDRGPSIFPHPLSAWWIPILLVIGWGALSFDDLFHLDGPGEDGWIFAIGNLITLPCSVAAMLSILLQMFRLVMYFLNRPKPITK